MQTEKALEVMARFYSALDRLVAFGVLRSSYDFCQRYGISLPNFQAQRRHPTRSQFKVDWLSLLVEDFGISALWLLTGRGEIIGTGETWVELVARLAPGGGEKNPSRNG